MASRGRKPIPPEMRQGRKINNGVPKVAGSPECPDFLDAIGKAKWSEMVGNLDAMGVLSLADGELLGIYCSAYSAWRGCLSGLATSGPVYTVDDVPRPHPLAIMRDRLAKQLAGLLAEMGMTPSARSRVQGKFGGEKPKLLKFLDDEL